MSSNLIHNISSNYIQAAGKIRGDHYRLVRVYVEGYDDIAFWRETLDEFETETLRFEVSVPVRKDLAKGKKVVLKMIPETGRNLILCIDSDFDYIFGDHTEQSRLINRLPYIFHTYVYAIENYYCYAAGLHAVCVKATKNDAQIFDFEQFMTDYSRTIYEAFLWYAYSAFKKNENGFPLIDFRNTVKLNYLDLENNGARTLEWLSRQVQRRLVHLRRENRSSIERIERFAHELKETYQVDETNCYLFMQGHTLYDSVVTVILKSVCERLKELSLDIINNSERSGLTLKNELSNYTNSLRSIDDILKSHNGYHRCPLYLKLKEDLRRFATNQISEKPEKRGETKSVKHSKTASTTA